MCAAANNDIQVKTFAAVHTASATESFAHTIEFAVAVDIYEAADQWKDFEITDVAPVQVTAYVYGHVSYNCMHE